MTQSFHADATPTHARVLSNRRRTDLTPTVTPSAMGTGLGQPMTSREISRASTPGKRMLMTNLNGPSSGKAVSMSRLDQLSRPRVLNLNRHQTLSPTEVSPSHAHSSLTSNARLNHGRDKMGQSPSKKFSSSMGHLNGPINGSSAPKLRQRMGPPLSASASTRTRPRADGKDDKGRFRFCSNYICWRSNVEMVHLMTRSVLYFWRLTFWWWNTPSFRESSFVASEFHNGTVFASFNSMYITNIILHAYLQYNNKNYIQIKMSN